MAVSLNCLFWNFSRIKFDTAANCHFCSEVNDSILVEFNTLMHSVPEFLAYFSLESDGFHIHFYSKPIAEDSRFLNDITYGCEVLWSYPSGGVRAKMPANTVSARET